MLAVFLTGFAANRVLKRILRPRGAPGIFGGHRLPTQPDAAVRWLKINFQIERFKK
jgi:hypothetical protein